jgi:hypothetical protein
VGVRDFTDRKYDDAMGRMLLCVCQIRGSEIVHMSRLCAHNVPQYQNVQGGEAIQCHHCEKVGNAQCVVALWTKMCRNHKTLGRSISALLIQRCLSTQCCLLDPHLFHDASCIPSMVKLWRTEREQIS